MASLSCIRTELYLHFEYPGHEKIIVVILITFAAIISASGQFSIIGKVIDSLTGSALTGANVLIRNTYLGMVSGPDGIFRFTNLQAGTYLLEVSYMGYQNYSQETELMSDTETEIQMVRQPLMQEEVQILATRIVQGMPEHTRTSLRNRSAGSTWVKIYLSC